MIDNQTSNHDGSAIRPLDQKEKRTHLSFTCPCYESLGTIEVEGTVPWLNICRVNEIKFTGCNSKHGVQSANPLDTCLGLDLWRTSVMVILPLPDINVATTC